MEEAIYIAEAVILVLLAIVVITQRGRLKRFEAKLGLDSVGFSVELHEMVKREVARVSLASLGRLAKVDRQLIEFWEKGKLLTSDDSAKRMDLFATEVTELEARLESAPLEDRYQLAAQLRELYWEYLRHAREHWASSPEYQAIRVRVVRGLERIETMGNSNVAQPRI